MEFGLLVAALLGLGASWLVARATVGGETRRVVFDRILTSAIVGLFAGRLGAMVIAGTNPLTHPRDILIVRGGVDTVVASAAALGFLAWGARRDLWRLADAAAPAVLAGLAGWQAGCAVRGACLGTPSSLPWAWSQSPGGVTRHPTEIYAALGLAAAAALLAIWRRRLSTRPGFVAAVALVSAATVRLVTEPLRLKIGPGPQWWYLTGIAAGLALAAWLLARRDERPPATA